MKLTTRTITREYGENGKITKEVEVIEERDIEERRSIQYIPVPHYPSYPTYPIVTYGTTCTGGGYATY